MGFLESELNKDDELIKLGLRIKSIRESKQLSQSQLGNVIGKDQQSIQRLETGKINPSYFYLLEICIGLQVDLNELVRVQ